MSLPTIEPLPDENTSLPPARRRRQKRTIIPPGSDERADLLRELSRRTVPSFDFFLFSLLAGFILGAGLLLDAPALVVLAALLAPFMAPAVGIALGTITGTGSFILQSMGSLGIGSLIVFFCGTVAGWAANLLPAHMYQQATYHSQFTWPDFFVLLIGAGLTAYLIVRFPHQRPLVASAAIAYELYPPAGVAGFGLSSGQSGLWTGALELFLIHLVWIILIGTLVLALLKLRPLNAAGYMLGAAYALVGVVALVAIYNSPQAIAPVLQVAQPTPMTAAAALEARQPSATPSPSPTQTASRPLATSTVTATPSPTFTYTPAFTSTPTSTITPTPTPAWARITASEGGGAIIREKPDFKAPIVQTLINSTLVQVLPEVEDAGMVHWIHVRLASGKDGWIVQDLIRTTTPVPTPVPGH